MELSTLALFYAIIFACPLSLSSAEGRKTQTHVVKPSCNENAHKCEFNFRIKEKYTMMWYDSEEAQILPVFMRADGPVYRDRHNCDHYTNLTEEGMLNF